MALGVSSQCYAQYTAILPSPEDDYLQFKGISRITQISTYKPEGSAEGLHCLLLKHWFSYGWFSTLLSIINEKDGLQSCFGKSDKFIHSFNKYSVST